MDQAIREALVRQVQLAQSRVARPAHLDAVSLELAAMSVVTKAFDDARQFTVGSLQ